MIFGVLEEAYELLLQLEFYLELGACSRATGNRDVELYSRFSQLSLTEWSTLHMEIQWRGKK